MRNSGSSGTHHAIINNIAAITGIASVEPIAPSEVWLTAIDNGVVGSEFALAPSIGEQTFLVTETTGIAIDEIARPARCTCGEDCYGVE